MKKYRITISICILSFLCVFMMQPITVDAASSLAFGQVTEWDPSVAFLYDNDYVILSNTYVNDYNTTDINGQIVPGIVDFLYEGTNDVILRFNLPSNYYYNGQFYKDYTFVIPDTVSLTDITRNYLDLDATINSIHDGVNVSPMIISNTDRNVTVRFYFQFQSYSPSLGSTYIPISLHFTFYGEANNYAADALPPAIRVEYNSSLSGTTYNGIKQYTDIRDLPGYKSENITLLSEISDYIAGLWASVDSGIGNIISKITEQTNSINNTIVSSIQGLASSIALHIDGIYMLLDNNHLEDQLQNQQQHSELVDGFQGTGTEQASDKFDQSAGELESIESELTGITNTSIDNYATAAFDSSIITTLGPSLVYVVTWFTNFWNMGGIFTSMLNVGLALFVAFFILRLHGGNK